MLFIYLATTSFFSRHLFCKLGEFRHFNRFHMYQGGMTISGLCVICLPLATSYGSLAAIFIVLGLMEGSSMGQFSLLLLKCVKQRQFNQAWGYLNFFMGITISIGPPLAGELLWFVLLIVGMTINPKWINVWTLIGWCIIFLFLSFPLRESLFSLCVLIDSFWQFFPSNYLFHIVQFFFYTAVNIWKSYMWMRFKKWIWKRSSQ